VNDWADLFQACPYNVAVLQLIPINANDHAVWAEQAVAVSCQREDKEKVLQLSQLYHQDEFQHLCITSLRGTISLYQEILI